MHQSSELVPDADTRCCVVTGRDTAQRPCRCMSCALALGRGISVYRSHHEEMVMEVDL